jgi:hypothetical protein
MTFPPRIVPLLALAAWLSAGFPLFSAEKKSIEFQGRVSAVDLAAKTLSVRTGRKEFVFSIDTHRCNIVKEGYYLFQPGGQPGTLRSAQVGDAVVGTLEVEPSGPVVTRLYLTAKPEPGIRVKGKPGFIDSPYHFIGPLSHTTEGRGAIDVRGYPRGSMLVDHATGKIFLVP